MFVEPVERELLRLGALLVAGAIVLDARDRNQLLYPRRPLVGQDGVVPIVEEFLILGDDEKLGDALAAVDVLDGGGKLAVNFPASIFLPADS